MALPDPGELAAGVLTTTWLNTMRDLGLAALNQEAVIGTRALGSTQSIPDNTVTAVTLPTETFDNMAGFTAGGSTVTLSEPGIYLLLGGGAYTSNATGLRTLILRHNGVDVVGGIDQRAAVGGGALGYVTIGQGISAAAGDSVTLNAFQTSGAALNIEACRLTVARVSGG